MPGSAWTRKDGRGGAEFSYKVGGRTKTVATTKPTCEEAEAWLAEKERDFADGVVSSGETVGEYLDAWLKESVEPQRARNTYLKRERDVRVHIKPALGGLKLSGLDGRAVEGLYGSMARAGYAYATRREVHVTLKMALSRAVRWGLIARNPVEMAEPPRNLKRGHEDAEVRHLADAEVRELFRHGSERWRDFYAFAVRTGLRPGEALGLRWADADVGADSDPGTVRVRRSLDPHTLAFNPPKSPAAKRTVALHFEAKDALLSQRARLRSEGLPAGPGDLVFPSKTGSPMSSDNLRKRTLKPDLVRIGLPAITLHDLRHSFASIMLHEWRVPPAVVSKMMGHASISFTFDVYGHLIPSATADEIRRLNDLHRPALAQGSSTRPENGRKAGRSPV